MARLLSVNVGRPREISWRGQTVYTSVWKEPVRERRLVRRLNIDGDAQGDLAGHGCEQRAVFVYQMESYRYWERELKRGDFTFGQFGENFTVEGLADSDGLLAKLPNARSHVRYSRPDATDRIGFDFDAAGHLTITVLEELGVPLEADFYLCGPPAFLADFTAGLNRWGVAHERIHTEVFGSGESITPGVTEAPQRTPHAPAGAVGEGPRISFARAGLTVSWDSRFQSLLELAEACDVPVRWSCRAGVCHTCECGLISGAVNYDPEPLDAPAVGNLLICCSRPREETVIEL